MNRFINFPFTPKARWPGEQGVCPLLLRLKRAGGRIRVLSGPEPWDRGRSLALSRLSQVCEYLCVSLELRNPHSVLAVLETRPKDVLQLNIPSQAHAGWETVADLAKKKGIP